MKTIALTFLLALPLVANTLPAEKRKNGPLIQKTLAPVQVSLQESSAVFYNDEDSRPFLYGTVVGKDGYLLTKASDLLEIKSYHVRVGTKKFREPVLVAKNDRWDVALVKIEAEDLLAVEMGEVKEITHGTWIVSNGATERRFRRPRAGIVSANTREIPGGSPAVLGVNLSFEDDKLMIGEVTADSGAEKSGLKKDDEITELDGEAVQDKKSFVEYLSEKSPGDTVKLKVNRDDDILDFEVELMARHKLYGERLTRNDQLSGGPEQQSARRSGFPMVFQHETMLTRRTVGGPVFTLEGAFVGMNIAAVNRVEAFAIPVKELAKVLEGLLKEKP